MYWIVLEQGVGMGEDEAKSKRKGSSDVREKKVRARDMDSKCSFYMKFNSKE